MVPLGRGTGLFGGSREIVFETEDGSFREQVFRNTVVFWGASFAPSGLRVSRGRGVHGFRGASPVANI